MSKRELVKEWWEVRITSTLSLGSTAKYPPHLWTFLYDTRDQAKKFAKAHKHLGNTTKVVHLKRYRLLNEPGTFPIGTRVHHRFSKMEGYITKKSGSGDKVLYSVNWVEGGKQVERDWWCYSHVLELVPPKVVQPLLCFADP